MKSTFRFLRVFTILVAMSSLIHLSVTGASPDKKPSENVSNSAYLTPAQAYAAEVLAYLLRITLGMAGDPEYRKRWRVRGLNEPLDFDSVVATMTEPDKNPLDLMVLDPNILDLTTVLYHYDKGLSLYEGDYGVTSIYPASEFIAIRLLLLKMMHNGEKVNLPAIMAREKLLRDPALEPTVEDLRAMNLTAGEFNFLRQIIHSKPHLIQYLKSPFLIKALWEGGLLKSDSLVQKKLSQAVYQKDACRHIEGSERPDAIKICFIPSMTDEFVHGKGAALNENRDVEPTPFLLRMESMLAREIEAATKTCMEKELFSPKMSQFPMDESDWEATWAGIVRKYLGFYAADERPYVVYPENAARAVRQICPQADFSVIILGSNVYKSIFFDQRTDSYPAVRWIYVDITEIRHLKGDENLDALACFIRKHIADRILADWINPDVVAPPIHEPFQ